MPAKGHLCIGVDSRSFFLRALTRNLHFRFPGSGGCSSFSVSQFSVFVDTRFEQFTHSPPDSTCLFFGRLAKEAAG